MRVGVSHFVIAELNFHRRSSPGTFLVATAGLEVSLMLARLRPWTYGTDQDSYGLVAFSQEQMGGRSNETTRELLCNVVAMSGLSHSLIWRLL